MIPVQVNRATSLCALVLIIACRPAGGAKQGSESTTVASTETASVAAQKPAADSIITRADLARIQGSPSAPIWVIEASDFQCPYCKDWHEQTYKTLVDQYVKTGKVRLAYVNFPLQSHAHALHAAEAAMCAGAQGKFWPMHDALFTTQAQWQSRGPTQVFDSLARAQGVQMEPWRNCVASGKMRPLIVADADRASRAGVRATPSFMIGNQLLVGAQSIDDLRRVIDSALAKSKRTTP